MAVSAVNASDTIASWSSRGTEVDLAAPGVDVPSTWNDRGYHVGGGTSMAIPHVAGTAALVIARYGQDLNRDGGIDGSGVQWLMQELQNNADDLGAPGLDVWYGYGLVDAEEAVTGTQSSP